MSQLFEEIKEQVRQEKINFFFNKYKYVFAISVFFFFCILMFFPIKDFYLKKKSENYVEIYLNLANFIDKKKQKELIIQLDKFKKVDQEFLKVLYYIKLIEINENNFDLTAKIIDEAIGKNFSQVYKDFFKIQKAFLFFDLIKNEKEFIKIISLPDFKNSPWKLIAYEITGDFYVSQKNFIKAKEVYFKILGEKNLNNSILLENIKIKYNLIN